ncbi:acyltransferase family protein [Leifsonia sp. NPDC058248]|uniref:acyltransferase family protein n=1 Tax=Leifsonia sp. NPDC058248 TaxID=3346402 RepID=UPI0036D84F9F
MPTSTESRSGARTTTASRVFPEIQALRTIAVAGVVIYHLFPGVLRGGYAGVDVFFVISGFLITTHLLRELDATGRIRFGAFYARRARRLLPAAFLVLAVTAVLTFVLLPDRFWSQVLQEIGASALYVENWLLAANSVDYLAQNIDIASPTQHYWSLSVEEQFYLIWPVLLLVGWWLSTKFWPQHRRTVLAIVLGLVLVGSLGTSIVQTAWNPGPAYFTTQTRAWEFAAGGLLGLFLVRSTRFAIGRSILSWLGLAAIALTFLAYTGATPFPGWAALLPVLGTVAVIAAGNPQPRWSPRPLMGLRPVQYAGDISYSLYLWHWPLAVFAIALLGTPGAVGHLAVAVLSVVLAALTKRYVEDPARSATWLTTRRPRFTLLLTAVAMAVTLTVVTTGSTLITNRIADDRQAALALLAEDGSCLGAAVLGNPACADVKLPGSLVPGVDAAPTDDVNSIDCWSRDGDDRLKVCSEGPAKGAALSVALVGDSHSNQYLAALKALAAKNRWHFDVYGKTGCIWSTAVQENTPAWVQSCESWKQKLEHRLTTIKPYDVVITSYSATSHIVAASGRSMKDTVIDGFVAVWKPVADRGTRIVAIKDNPRPRVDYLKCIDEHQSTAATACANDEDTAFHYFDGQPQAVSRVPGASLLDLSRYFCRERSCAPVIGDVIVYRDANHVTSSYTRTLAPYVREGVLSLTGLKEKPAA